MEERKGIKGLPYVAGQQATALILGSYPSPKRFETGFNDGHPQNRFWRLMAHLSGRPVPQDISQKQQLIVESGLALWDVLESCRIMGASDSSIQDPVPNDIGTLIAEKGIRAIFCNGTSACKFYRAFWLPQTGIEPVCLPSTSPANAAYTFDKLVASWQPLASYIRL